MCPLQSFWMKVQPLTGNLCNLTWNSICRSSSTALAPSSGDDAVVNHTTATIPTWTMDQFRLAAMRAVSTFQLASSSWLLGSNVILRMQDSAAAAAAATATAASSSATPMRTKPLRTTVAICEADQRAATQQQRRRATTSKRLSDATTAANSVLSSNDIAAATPLQQSQQILQAQDYILHQIPPPPTPLVRRLSKEWVSDYKHEARIDKINYNNIFGGVSDASNNEIPILSPPSPATTSTTRTPSPSPTLSSSSHDHHHLNSCPSPSPTSVVSMDTTTDGNNKNMMLWPKYFTQTSSTSSVSTTSTTTDELSLRSPSPILSSTSPTTIPSSSSSLSHHQQESSLSSITTPSTHDVICGRGGKANTHPGNISFRTEAKKLRDWYDSSSKSEKFTISSYLVDIVRERGGRFLMRDKDSPNVWHEAESGDVRKKASQALREGRAGGGGG